MTENRMFEKCRSLLFLYGYEKGGLGYYYDSLGCDFYIVHMVYASGEEAISAYLGGRKIYDNARDDKIDLSVDDPTWFDFIDELENREYNRTATIDGPITEKTTIIEMYRRRSSEYRRFLERYSNMGMVVAKKFGTVKKHINDRSTLVSCIEYSFKFTEEDYELRVRYSMEASHDHVGIFYNNIMVFSYFLTGYGVSGLEFTGNYIDNAVWERILFGLYVSATEGDDRQT